MRVAIVFVLGGLAGEAMAQRRESSAILYCVLAVAVAHC
jgi:hypothetical protein